MQIHKNEITTGIFVLVTLGILIVVLVIIGMPGIIKPLNTYRIFFDNAEGIRPGAPVLLAGREIGQVSKLQSPIPMEYRPKGHPNYEVAVEVEVERAAMVYHKVIVRLKQQGLMGQMVIDFVEGDEKSELASNHAEFAGERVPDFSESVSDQIKRLTGEGSDLSALIKNVRQMTDTLKREPWRLVWPSTKKYPEDEKGKGKKDQQQDEQKDE